MKKMNGVKMAMAFETPADGGGGTAVAAPAAPAPAAPASRAPAAPAPRKNGIFDHPVPDSLKRQKGGSLDPARTAPPPPAAAAPAPAAPATEDFNVVANDGKTVLGSFKTQAEAEAFVKSKGLTPAAAAPAAEEGTFNVMSDDGKEVVGNFKTRAEAEAFVASGSKAPAAKPAGAALTRPFMGRTEISTQEEAEAAYRRTEVEAGRLFKENKTLKESLQNDVADRDAKLKALQAEFEAYKATPQAKELSKEELTELWKADPAAAGEYVTAKMLRDRDQKTAKESTQAKAREAQEKLARTNQEIESHRATMQKDTANFPHFEEMAPKMGQLLDKTLDATGATPLRGHVWAEELLYLAAIGHSTRESWKTGKIVAVGAADKAAKTAAAAAIAAAGPSGAGDGKGSGAGYPPATKQSKGSRIVAAAPRTRIFTGGKQ